MTAGVEKWIEKRAKIKPLLAFCMLILVFYFALALSGKMSAGIKEGLALGALTVLPSSIPFMIISDLYYAYGYPERIGLLGKAVKTLFHLPEGAVRALVLGNAAGFPIGAKIAAELYTGGGIDKKNAEKLIAYSNNPSVPFIVSCVGESILGDVKIGVFLLTIIYISTVLCAIIYRPKIKSCGRVQPLTAYHFSLVKSVRRAGEVSITILAFISLFYGIITLLSQYIKNGYILSLISSLTEVTSAVSIATKTDAPFIFKLTVVAFALGFGGLSVMMQTAVFTESAGLSLKPYLKIKLTEGVFSALLCVLFYPLVFE